MKKTLIMLLALAGVAAAAPETLTFDVERSENDVTFEFADAAALTMTYSDWTYSGGGTNNVGSWKTPDNVAYQNSFSPDAQLRDGVNNTNFPDSWTMNFSVTNNTGVAITLTQFTFDAYAFNGDGSDKGTSTYVALTLGQITTDRFLLGVEGNTATGTLDLSGSNAITIGANQTVELALKMSGADPYNTYTGITGGSVTYAAVPEPTTATLSLLALAGLAARRRRR